MTYSDSLGTQHLLVLCSSDADYLQQLLTSINSTELEIVQAVDEQQAILLLETQFPELMIVDESFSNMGGYHFCAGLQSMPCCDNTAIAMLVESADEQTLSKVSASAATDFLTKSTTSPVLDFRLKSLLQQADFKRAGKQQAGQAKYDLLTGLLNRQHFHRIFEQLLLRAKLAQRPGAVIVIDIDNFKRINSMFDYQGGDHILNVLGQRLSAGIRTGDLLMREADDMPAGPSLARLGGDEFTMFIDGVGSVDSVVAIVKRCLTAIAAPVLIAGQEVVLTPSIGIALFATDGEDVNTLLKNAERAMYAAKAMGGGSYKFFRKEMSEEANSHFMLESDLRTALEQEQLLLHYQPQVEAHTGKVESVEVLCRWLHPTLGMVPPDKFIPLAESSGLIVPIGDWVLRTACKQARCWLEQGIKINRIAVNVSAFQFHRADFIDKLKFALGDSYLSPRYLELELTESIVMSDADEIICKLNQLKSLGIKLAVDDFGTGYSSLSYLKRLPVDTLKIDRSFITNLTHETTDCAIVSAILTLADKLSLNVVAEGVEDFEQLNFLRQNNCTMLQGFYFSAARPADAVANMLGTTMSVDKPSI